MQVFNYNSSYVCTLTHSGTFMLHTFKLEMQVLHKLNYNYVIIHITEIVDATGWGNTKLQKDFTYVG